MYKHKTKKMDGFIVCVKRKKYEDIADDLDVLLFSYINVIAIKREKVTKKCLLKWGFKFEDYKSFLKNNIKMSK